MTVDGQPIEADDLDALLEEVLRASTPGEAAHGPATEFELFAAAAFLWSARRRVDVAVMEVGLGGRLDATNTWAADVAAITNVGLDHQAYLGDTIVSIAVEKAAIIKPGCRAVTGADGEALEVIAARGRDVGACRSHSARPLPVVRMDLAGLTLLEPRCRPAAGCPSLGVIRRSTPPWPSASWRPSARPAWRDVPDAAIAAGLAAARWPGRLEVLHHGGPGRAARWRPQPRWRGRPGGGPRRACAGDCPPARPSCCWPSCPTRPSGESSPLWRPLRSSRAAHCLVTRVPDSERSLAAAELALAWEAATGRPAEAIDDADAALDHALRLAVATGGPLLVSGSLYLVGHVRSRLLPDRKAA